MIQGHLRRFPRFDTVSDEEIRILERAFDAQKVRPGTVVFREGEQAAGRSAAMFLVLEGAVEVGHHRYSRGELFGVVALVRDIERPETATVTERGLIACIDRAALDRLAVKHPIAWSHLQEIVAKQLTADFRAIHDQIGEALG